MPYICNDCPRHCRVARSTTPLPGKQLPGYCHCPSEPLAARAALHYWEEPCISGTRGSGTIFFTGCNLRCCFCQNSRISQDGYGFPVSPLQLRRIYQTLIRQGAHNINLVTPTPYKKAILDSLQTPLPVPVIYNCGGYESVETIHELKGKIQIYIPDFKYMDTQAAARYSDAENYPEIAQQAILAMYEQVGAYQADSRGILQKGVIIRHLVLPGLLKNTYAVIDWVRKTFAPNQVLFSLMRQYVPCGQAARYPEINRPLSAREYKKAEQYLFDSGIEDGFVQEKASADKNFIPLFDGTGII